MHTVLRKKTWIVGHQKTQVCLGPLDAIMKQVRRRWSPSISVFILTDSLVSALHLNPVYQAFHSHYARTAVEVIPAGEIHKNLDTAYQIITRLLMGGFSRDSLLVGLGGGVICDLAGFVAATYQRGIDLLLLPTTLLAQVDAALGGKYGVNHRLAKNSIGGTRQPALIGLEVHFLSSLPVRAFCSGCAELVKYGMVCSADFFEWLTAHADSLLRRETKVLLRCIWWAVHLKYTVVQADAEDKRDLRAILNFGHTFGHAIERAQNYTGLLHGEAVSIGMMLATAWATTHTALPEQIKIQLNSLLATFQLPRCLPEMTAAMYVDPMQHDKKRQGGLLRLVLPQKIGQATLLHVHPRALRDWLEQYLA